MLYREFIRECGLEFGTGGLGRILRPLCFSDLSLYAGWLLLLFPSFMCRHHAYFMFELTLFGISFNPSRHPIEIDSWGGKMSALAEEYDGSNGTINGSTLNSLSPLEGPRVALMESVRRSRSFSAYVRKQQPVQ